jgi:glycosyltransferase involved in cell wall biosynthesis
MRVWIVNHYAVRPSDAGGTRHFSLARRLTELGHEVTIIASAFDHSSRTERHLRPGEGWAVETIDGIHFLWIRTPPYQGNTGARVWNMISFAWVVLRGRATRGLATPDVILGSSPHLFAAFAAQCVASRRGLPFVLEIRDIWPETLVLLGGYSRWHPFIMLLAWMERRLYRRSGAVVTLLPRSGEHVVKCGGHDSSLAYVPNGVDLSLFPEQKEAEDVGTVTLMYAGAHGSANNLDYLLDCASVLQAEGIRDVRFVLVGDGPDKSRLQQRAHSQELKNVVFRPPVPKREMARLLQEADGFLMVLRSSPLFQWGISPNKLWDYMAVGRPVFFAVSTPFNPVAEASSGFTVDPADPRDLAAAIRQFRSLPHDQRVAMGRRGREFVAREHDMKKLGDRLESVLVSLVSRTR